MSSLQAAALALAESLRGQSPTAVSEVWAKGPTTQSKQVRQPIAQYIAWLGEMNDSLDSEVTFAERCQRMRRLYYSDFTDPGTIPTGVGGRFDWIIKAVQSNSKPPLITGPKLSLTALNGLYGCDVVVTPNGSEIDPSHIFVALDVARNGVGSTAGAFATGELSTLSWPGTLTWVGDLASWWMEWALVRRERSSAGNALSTHAERLAVLESITTSRVSKVDLLGDMDGQVIAADLSAAATLGLPGILNSYYGGGNQSPNSQTRFQDFVRRAQPIIGWKLTDNDSSKIDLLPQAFDQIHQAIRSSALLFITMGTKSLTRLDLTVGADMLREVTNRFLAFLEEGLATNTATWPRT